MNVKIMEGLAGASASIQLTAAPMSAVKEAERKGDTDKMQRALGYAAMLTEQADAYSEKTSQGMKLDAEEAKKQEELRQEKLAETKKAEAKAEKKQTETEPGTEEKTKVPEYDSAEISEEGKYQAKLTGQTAADSVAVMGNITYNPSGEVAEIVQETGNAVDVRG